MPHATLIFPTVASWALGAGRVQPGLDRWVNYSTWNIWLNLPYNFFPQNIGFLVHDQGANGFGKKNVNLFLDYML